MSLMQTPRQIQDQNSAALRAQASATGRPLRRAHFPGTLPDPVLVWRSGRELMASVPAGIENLPAGRTKATAELVYLVLCTTERTLIVGDRADLRATAKLIADTGSDEQLRGWNAINSTSNAYSVRTLVSALNYSWWAPDHVDTEDVDSWAEAFGVTSPDRHSMLRALATKSSETVKALQQGTLPPSPVMALVRREASLVSSAKYVGLAADCRLHDSIETVTGLQSDLSLADPGLLEHHKVDGSVCQLTGAVDKGHNRFEFRATSPFRSKAGRQVIITDGSTQLPSSFRGIIGTSFRDGSVFITIEFRARDVHWVGLTEKAGLPFFIRDKPFDGVSRGGGSVGRWQKPKEVPTAVEGREVPLDVILAGGPS
ncbi:hypothetical protein LG293_16250 (plasmid) [Citricoccus nitrophenolicus]